MKNEIKTWLKLSALIIYIGIIVGIEYIYRDVLFLKSLIWIKTWQSQSTDGLSTFFKILAEFGSFPILAPLFLITFFGMNLGRSFTFFLIVMSALYIDNNLKILYGNPPPFWVAPSIQKVCEGGYGNPSGHASVSLPFYLTFWHILVSYKQWKTNKCLNIFKWFLLFMFIILVIGICLSRIYLAAHTVNQIIYGLCWGFAVYFFIIHVLQVHKYKNKDFFNIFILKNNIIMFAIIYTLCLTLIVLEYVFIQHDNSLYEKNINQVCFGKDAIPEQVRYEKSAFMAGLSIVGIAAMHFGITFLALMALKDYPGKYYELFNWYRGAWLNQLFKWLLFPIFIIGGILALVIPFNSAQWVYFTFKIGLTFLLVLWPMFGPYIYSCIKLKIANPAINTQLNGNYIPDENNQNQVL